MLTLDSFDTQLDKNTVQKGRGYFTKKAVLYLEQPGEAQWNAEVEGTEVYSVEIQLEGRTVTDSFCDCPVESPVCKHIAAVLFALREKLKQPQPKPRKASKKLTIEDLLQKVTTDELRRFVATQAAADPAFASKVQLYFADKDERIDVAKHYRELVRKAIKTHSSRGFVEYRSSGKLAREMTRLLAEGRRLFGQQNYRDALTVGRVVLTEMMAVLAQSDDSAGYLGDTVSSAFELLKHLAESDEVAQPLRRQLFDFLTHELQNKAYFGYGDYGSQLLYTAFGLAINLNEPDPFLERIDHLIPLYQNAYGGYTLDLLRTTQIRFLKAIGRTAEARERANASLDVVAVRQDAVSEAIQALQFQEAKALIQEGIQRAEEKRHPGTVRQWNEQLLKIAYLEHDIPGIRRLTKAFAFDQGSVSIPYYRQWKQTFSDAEWRIEYETLIRSIVEAAEKESRQHKAYWFYTTHTLFYQLEPLYVEEKQWLALLDLVQKGPRLDQLERVYPHLVTRFPAEVLALYLPLLEEFGKTAQDRSDYRQVAQLIQKLKHDLPESIPVMNALVQQLKDRNPRRPAFLEELNRIP
ncbi:SWIM zinc finger domain-containing protein [Larkinella bovis]|uniref:SWIM zinc finger domain-containing protein n=1 Tax=Larkinella bovis TaxID=683041 RepID=A0ABW0I649_9BACT